MTRPPRDALQYDTLMAYADHALPPDEMRRVAGVVAADHHARRTIIALRRVGLLIDRAYGDVDFAAGSEKFQRLVLNSGQNSLIVCTTRLRDQIPALRDLMMPRMLPAMVLAAVVGGVAVAFGPIVALRYGAGQGSTTGPFMRTASGPNSPAPAADPLATRRQLTQLALALGEVATGSELWRALEALQRGEAIPVDGAAGPAFRGAMRFLDRYGNACHEVDVEEAGKKHSTIGVLVACQSDPGRWSLIAGAQTRDPGRSVGRPYVADADAAHDAMAGILKMIGARQQTTALEEANSER